MNMLHCVMPISLFFRVLGLLVSVIVFWLLNVSHFGVGHPVYIVGKLKIGVLI